MIQEIFGVNHHIRTSATGFADEGYAAVAPALFDRTEKDFQSGYTPPRDRQCAQLHRQARLRRHAARHRKRPSRRSPGGAGRHHGLLHGGSIAFLGREGSRPAAAVCYYGGHIVKFVDEKPKCPTQMHFGEKDARIPMSDVETIKQKRRGECEIYVYPDAAHGFHCDERGSFHKGSRRHGVRAHQGVPCQEYEEIRPRIVALVIRVDIKFHLPASVPGRDIENL